MIIWSFKQVGFVQIFTILFDYFYDPIEICIFKYGNSSFSKIILSFNRQKEIKSNAKKNRAKSNLCHGWNFIVNPGRDSGSFLLAD